MHSLYFKLILSLLPLNHKKYKIKTLFVKGSAKVE